MPASPGTSSKTSIKTRNLQAVPVTDDNYDNIHFWDSTLGVALLEWLLALKDQDWLFSQIPGAQQLFLEGTVTIRGRTMYENSDHKESATYDRTIYFAPRPTLSSTCAVLSALLVAMSWPQRVRARSTPRASTSPHAHVGS